MNEPLKVYIIPTAEWYHADATHIIETTTRKGDMAFVPVIVIKDIVEGTCIQVDIGHCVVYYGGLA